MVGRAPTGSRSGSPRCRSAGWRRWGPARPRSRRSCVGLGRRRRGDLDQRVVGLGPADDLADVDLVAPERPRHLLVGLEEEPGAPDERRDVVGVEANRADARARSVATRCTSPGRRLVTRPTTRWSSYAPAPCDRARSPHRRVTWPTGPDGATIQTGIGVDTERDHGGLVDHHDLGIHTELISDGVMELVERGVVNGVAKQLNRTKTVGTFALGTPAPVRLPRREHGVRAVARRATSTTRGSSPQEPNFVSINATIAVDLLGQCASETVAGTYYSSSGGHADFARGAMYSDGGRVSSCSTRRRRRNHQAGSSPSSRRLVW